MNTTDIEYLHKTLNPVVGCSRGCPYCWSARIENRFGDGDHSKLKYYYDRLKEITFRQKALRIGMNFRADFLDKKMTWKMRAAIVNAMRACPQHRFIMLTKNTPSMVQPKKIDCIHLPDNCWFGLTVAEPRVNMHNSFPWKGSEWRVNAMVNNPEDLRKMARHVFVNFEPLIGEPEEKTVASIYRLLDPEWIIVGGLTQPLRPPPRSWIEMVTAPAREKGIPVFIKDNVGDLAGVKHRYQMPAALRVKRDDDEGLATFM